MFGALSHTWELLGSSFHVLSKDKELMIFPIISGIVSVLVMASFAGGFYGVGGMETLQAVTDESGEAQLTTAQQVGYALTAFAFYFVSYFVVIYFNAALIGAAHIRLTGGDPTVADGFAAANRCLPAITGWALVAATVGMLLNMLENRSQGLARLVTGLIGMAWTVITFLVVPVIVIERASPIAAIKRSTKMLGDTWGPQLVSHLSFGLIGFLVSLPAIAVLAFGVVLVAGGTVALGTALLAVGILAVLLIAIVLTTLKGIFTAALYAHAAHERLDYFSSSQLSASFTTRG
jgi:hypothetical protein